MQSLDVGYSRSQEAHFISRPSSFLKSKSGDHHYLPSLGNPLSMYAYIELQTRRDLSCTSRKKDLEHHCTGCSLSLSWICPPSCNTILQSNSIWTIGLLWLPQHLTLPILLITTPHHNWSVSFSHPTTILASDALFIENPKPPHAVGKEFDISYNLSYFFTPTW